MKELKEKCLCHYLDLQSGWVKKTGLLAGQLFPWTESQTLTRMAMWREKENREIFLVLGQEQNFGNHFLKGNVKYFLKLTKL